jgi:imidazole glycerol-phosphate synthase subunit HisH
MASAEVAVIDYGVGNLLSVRRALEHCGAAVTVTSDPGLILAADRVVLPGVGAFANGMAALERQGLAVTVREVAARGRLLLGICLGMQMLFDNSTEFGVTPGLGLIAGTVVAVPSTSSTGHALKIPHIGWNALVLPGGCENWSETLVQDLRPGEAAYFVHSFMASPADQRNRIADCLYGENPIAAVVGRDNVLGCQFHPEKSGDAGLTVLRRFLRM